MPEARTATLTAPATQGYGARPMAAARTRCLAALALSLAACAPVERPPGPLDRFTFPTGLAIEGGHLVVVSSNFDLNYEDDKGGSVLTVDPDAWHADDKVFLGALRMPSFGGAVAIATPAACGIPSTQALVANRLSGVLYRLALGSDGSLACGEGCEVEVSDPGDGFPFGIALACRPGRPLAYVGLLSSNDHNSHLREVRLDEEPPVVGRGIVLSGGGGIRSLAYDPSLDRLLFVTTGVNAGNTTAARVGWMDLSTGCSLRDENCLAGTFSVALSGAEMRSVAIATPRPGLPERLFVGARIVDPGAYLLGVRIDVGGVLLVVDLEEQPNGFLAATIVRQVPMARGLSEVLVLPPRAGRGDVVAVTATDDGEVWFYDDEIGAVTGLIGRGQDGVPLVGDRPYGLAAEPRGGDVRLFVGAFGGGFVTVLDLDPDDPGTPLDTWRIGG